MHGELEQSPHNFRCANIACVDVRLDFVDLRLHLHTRASVAFESIFVNVFDQANVGDHFHIDMGIESL